MFLPQSRHARLAQAIGHTPSGATLPRRLQALTLEEVNGAIKTFLHPDKMVVVMAGTLPAGEPTK